jgi:peptidyl-dipeptidase A
MYDGGIMRKVALAAVIGLLLGLTACSPKTESGTPGQDVASFLRDYEAKVKPLTIASNLASFTATVSGKEEDYETSMQAQVALEKIHADTAAYARVAAFRESGQVTDPILRRELEIVYLAYKGGQIDPAMMEELIRRQTAIEQKFNTYRVQVGQRTINDNQVDSTLRYSINSQDLEETWKASKQIGAVVAPDLIALAKLRNQASTALGYANYYEMQLRLGEQDPAEVAALFDQLDSLTGDAYAVLKGQIDSALALRYGIPKDQLRPWHYQNRFFQEAPTIYHVDLDGFYRDKDPVELTRIYFAGIGVPVDSILAHSDLYERPGKYQHAQCYDIDNEGDVRAICNVRPDYYWMNTMLHELGHGIYSYYYDPQAPWILRDPAHALTTEAVANFFGRLAANPQWLEQVAGVSKERIEPVAAECRRMTRLEQLVFSRWAQVMVRFERAFYENPDQDLNKLWWDLVTKYQGLTPLPGRNEPDWASKIHLASAPVYYHNYLIAELLASQLAHTIGQTVLNAPDPYASGFCGDGRIGAFFVDKVFHLGRKYPWNEMIEKATGEKLTPVYYAKQFIGAE